MDNVDKIPVRQDVTVLPSDDSKKLKLGFVIYEWPLNPQSLNQEEKEEWEKKKQAVLDQIDQYPSYDTGESDKFFSNNGIPVENSKKYGKSWTSINILEDLIGHPWNNLALAYVYAFDPRTIRVTTGAITLDCCPGRITVYLEEDERTIRKISKEVEIPCIGAQNASHLERLRDDPQAQPTFQAQTFINDDCADKVVRKEKGK